MNHPDTSPNLFQKPVEDYLRVMTAAPEVAVADPRANAKTIAEAYEQARQEQAELLVLPELCVSGYTTADMFFNRQILRRSIEAIDELAALTKDGPAMVAGAPIEHNGILYNCAIMLAEGEVQGVVPKSFLPNYNEFYEMRWFSSGRRQHDQTITLGGKAVPFGTDILFEINDTKVGVEICEDGWAAISPGTRAALQGAEVIVNLSASNELTGKASFRRQLVTDHASRLICAYVYTSAGAGESVADTVWSGHQLIGENGHLSAEIKPFEPGRLVYDVDREYLDADRAVNKTFAEEALDERESRHYRTIAISVPRPTDDRLLRKVEGRPFGSPEACAEVFDIVSQGLAQRAREINTHALVIGLSGGLDSTLAALIAEEAARKLGKTNDFIHTITMPGMASSERTQDNATLMAEAMGTTHQIMPIRKLSNGLLEIIGHTSNTQDITYENTQARTRTEILMNYANMVGGIVQGTGDMSESDQGWCTYNGDHMSMYNPNANIFKPMIKDMIRWYADTKATPELQAVLHDILDTPISPELTGDGDLSQETEDSIGPFELTAFFKLELQRRRSAPSKIGYLATQADFEQEYTQAEIAAWLDSFLTNYTRNQWKRDVAPNSPMTGSVGNSPRGPLRLATNMSPDWHR